MLDVGRWTFDVRLPNKLRLRRALRIAIAAPSQRTSFALTKRAVSHPPPSPPIVQTDNPHPMAHKRRPLSKPPTAQQSIPPIVPQKFQPAHSAQLRTNAGVPP